MAKPVAKQYFRKFLSRTNTFFGRRKRNESVYTPSENFKLPNYYKKPSANQLSQRQNASGCEVSKRTLDEIFDLGFTAKVFG